MIEKKGFVDTLVGESYYVSQGESVVLYVILSVWRADGSIPRGAHDPLLTDYGVGLSVHT